MTIPVTPKYEQSAPAYQEQEIDKRIHIALSVYDLNGTYSRHAGVVIASVLRNTDAEVCFHILHDETLTVDNRDKLCEIVTGMSSRTSDIIDSAIDFVDVSGIFEQIQNVDIEKVSLRFTKGALFRLALPDVLPTLNKIIYLDCDMVVTLDIMDLWKIDLNGYALAGVLAKHVVTVGNENLSLPDQAITKDKIKTNSMGINEGRYINSGMLLMNLHKIRDSGKEKGYLLKRAVSYIVQHGAILPDEEFLNAEYLGDIIFLDRRYNADPGMNITKT